MARVSVIADGASLLVQFPFDRNALNDLKQSVPSSDRRWDNGRKVWVVAASHAQTIESIAQAYFGERLSIPVAMVTPTVPETRLLELRYLGRCKDRGDGTSSATGYVNGSWSVVFLESALRSWFQAVEDGTAGRDQPATLYAVLAVPASATLAMLTSAYRSLVKQWHPDVCKEPDAAEQFRRIQHAWEVLGDETRRRKYDAGMALEASLKQREQRPVFSYSYGAAGYRSPLRCGYVLAEGTERIGMFGASKILAWEPITRADGKELVTSWPTGGQTFEERWV